MERLDNANHSRRFNASLLSEGLAPLDWLVTPVEPNGRIHVFHQYTIRLRSDAPVDRRQLQQVLDESGIDSALVYPRVVYDYECFLSHSLVKADPVPTASRYAASVLSLPVHPGVTAADIDRIVTVISSIEKSAA